MSGERLDLKEKAPFEPVLLTQLNSDLILILSLNKAINMMFHVTTMRILEINSSLTPYCTYVNSFDSTIMFVDAWNN